MLRDSPVKIFLKILFAALFISSGFLLAGYASAQADMEHYEHVAGGQEVIAAVGTEPENLTAGNPATVLFTLKDREGNPVENLTIHHDRLLHVVIASQDFTVFAHIHPEDFGPVTPEMKKTGRYPVRFTFPKAGRYIVGLDFAVKGYLFSRHFLLAVEGTPEMGSPKKDLTGEKRFDGLDVSFSPAPGPVVTGKEVVFSYVFKKNGKPVIDLEPYLSAPMHLAVISADLEHFIHTHGELPGMPGMGQHEHHMEMKMPASEKFGPKVEVHVVFPTKGLYQIFGQVGHEGRVILTSFMVEVR
ncbi:MAG: FixH family protein [Nitrospirae bacterium]|nr:FixH family protein [Nitrospirota bacterium]